MDKQTFTTISSPEFINLEPLDINPLMSKCEIKVFYLGENRNGDYINKETAAGLAKTLRGAPIVGYFKEEKEDFADHGDVVTIDDEGIHFECKTRPYGFVAPDAQVWFQKFSEANDFGEAIEREYLMTTGYLWTGQYEEAKLAVEGEGKPQSMEITNVDGHWGTNSRGMDFYIITDATFSKLCILGDDVEPCFEGARVAAPAVSKSFTKVDDDFKKTLFAMMEELKFALEGGKQMEDSTTKVYEDEEQKKKRLLNEGIPQTPIVEEENNQGTGTETTDAGSAEQNAETTPGANDQGEETTPTTEETNTTVTEPTGEQTGEQTQTTETTDPAETTGTDTPGEGGTEGGNGEAPAGDGAYALLEEKYASLQTANEALQQAFDALQNQYAALQEQNATLVAFKKSIDDAKKDDMINSFYMLSDEDKAEVIQHKDQYSLEDIESKLSVICVRKRVNFDSDNTAKNHNNTEGDKSSFVYSLNDNTPSDIPAWLQAVIENKNSKEI